MPHEKKVVLWSQPIITGRRTGGDLKPGGGSLVVANISKRSIVLHHEWYDRHGSIIGEGYNTVEPGHVTGTNQFNSSDLGREYMYCKLWFNGSKDDIQASLVMCTHEGPLGSEELTPVHSVALS